MFRFRQRDLSYVELLKQSVSEEEWTALRGELLAAPSLRFQRRELQMREGMQEQVLKEIEDSNCPSSILDYEKELRKHYPDRVRNLLLKHFDMRMNQASSRGAYAGSAYSVKLLYSYP